jgi:hypothetical protein
MVEVRQHFSIGGKIKKGRIALSLQKTKSLEEILIVYRSLLNALAIGHMKWKNQKKEQQTLAPSWIKVMLAISPRK